MTAVEFAAVGGGAPSTTVPADGTVSYALKVTHGDGSVQTLTEGFTLTSSDASKVSVSGNTATWVAAGSAKLTADYRGHNAELSVTAAEKAGA